MARLLYSANDPSGNSKAGLIDAASAEEALAKLRAAGFSAIQLHDEPSVAAQRTDRLDLDDEEAAALAAFELRVRQSPGLATVLAEVARRSWLWLAIVGAVAAWGLAAGNVAAAATGAALLGLTFAIPAWRFRHAARYDQLQSAFAVGDWPRARALIQAMRSAQQPDNLLFDLDIRAATIEAVEGRGAQALAALEKWRAPLASAAPGLFESRVASVHHAAGDYKGFVEQMRQATLALPGDPSRQLDLALAEARLGDLDVAQGLLDALHVDGLPTHGRPFIDWTRGMIALRRDHPSAHEHLAHAIAGFLQYGNNPAVWGALALCSGAYALALARAGQLDHARQTLDRVSPMLEAQADKPLLRMLQLEVRGQQAGSC